MLALKSAVKFMSETKLLALITTLRTVIAPMFIMIVTIIIMQMNLAYGPIGVGYTK